MALVSNSVEVTKILATPITKLSVLDAGAPIRIAKGFIAAVNFTGGTVGQWYTFARVPARARVMGIFRTNLTSVTGAVKWGLYRPNGIAISDAVFAAVDATAAGNATKVDTAQTAAQRRDNLATAYLTAISTAGAASDVEFDIAAAIVTVIGTPVDMLMEVQYVVED